MRVEREFAIYAVLLVALAANPAWLFPHADEPAYEYRAVEITDENQHRYVERHPEVLECSIEYERACGFEVAALQSGVTLNTSETLYGASGEYSYVDFPTEYYRPTVVKTNDSARLTLERVTARQIVADLAYPYAEATDEARKVVRQGNATVRGEIPTRDRIVRRNGTYYAIDQGSYRGQPLGGWLPRVRWLMWLGTVPLSFAAMWRWC